MPITFGTVLTPKTRGKKSTNSQISPGTTDENKNAKKQVCNIIILLDSVNSALIVHNDGFHKHHNFLKQNKNKWSTIPVTFITTSTTELKVKLLESNHIKEILR